MILQISPKIDFAIIPDVAYLQALLESKLNIREEFLCHRRVTLTLEEGVAEEVRLNTRHQRHACTALLGECNDLTFFNSTEI